MSGWSLERVLGGLHDEIQRRLDRARDLGHPVAKGDASETIWLELLNGYLPERYRADRCFVVDSEGAFSQQIDVVIFDRQYTPFIAHFEGQNVIPAESVYGVFEAKQALNATHVRYAQEKAATVRALHRTSLPTPTNTGIVDPKTPHRILAGVLTFESDWNPALGHPLLNALADGQGDRLLDLGCVAAHGMFVCEPEGKHVIAPGGKPATAFLLELIAQLQACGTVPMIDVRAYARWLNAGA
jgi:hypothetical protein